MTISESHFTGSEGTFTAWVGGTYMLRYRLIGDDPLQSVPSILDEAAALTGDNDPVPLPGAVYIDDTGSRARVFQVQQLAQDGGLSQYDCTVTFSPNADGQGDQPHNTDPLLWQPVLWYEYDRLRRPIRVGRNVVEHPYNGVFPPRLVDTPGPITNTANFDLEVTAEEEVETRTLVATKNYADITALNAVADAFEGTWNNATFYGRPAGFARFLSIRASQPKLYRNNVYYEGTIRIALDRNDYQVGRLALDNVGLYQIGTATKPAPCLDSSALMASSPMALDINGLQAPTNNAIKVEYDYLTAADYSLLGIGT